MTEYLIKKGNHYPSPQTFKLKGCIKECEGMFCIQANCHYEETTIFINKICGFTNDIFGRESIRLGWRPNDEHTYKLYAYLHKNGKRLVPLKLKDHYIGEFYYDYYVSFKIMINEQNLFIKAQNATEENWIMIPEVFTCGIGYYQYPYFGGKQTAPHDMTIGVTI